MKKNIILLGTLALTCATGFSQGIVAGWDFKSIPNIATGVDSYSAEHTGFNNGNLTNGTLYTDGSFTSTNFVQNPNSSATTRWIAAGRQATGLQAANGFDQALTNNIGTVSNGNLGLEFLNSTTNYQFVIGFTSSFDVSVYYDFSSSQGSGAPLGDYINISYSADGINWDAYAPNSGGSTVAPNGYAAIENTSGWSASTDEGGLLALADGQTNSVVDLTSLTSDASSAIQFVRFEVDAPTTLSGRQAFDNILVTGTAVPEPSTYAAIFGMVVFAFTALRRRK